MRSRKFLSLWVSIALLGVLSGSGSVLLWSRMAKTNQGLLDSSGPFNPATWAWKNEEHWAVDQMAKDIVEMMCFVAKQDPSRAVVKTTPAGLHGYRVKVTGPCFRTPYETQLELKEFLWNPATFSPMVKDLVRIMGIQPGEDPVSSVMSSLLDPRALEIEKAQADVSFALTNNPASAGLHEQAALVLGVLGLFEQAGAFQDHRFILCRMTSHLAVAGGLRTGDPTPEGKAARDGLLTLVGRKAQAAGEIQDLKKDRAIPPPWVSTLYMLSSGDWRPVEDPAKVSLAEVLASFKGRSIHQGADQAANWVQESGRPDLPMGYVARVTFQGNGYSVATASRYAPPSVEVDMADLRAVKKLHDGSSLLSDRETCEALCAHPCRGWNPASKKLEVLSWGLWAQHFQAELLDDMMRTINYYNIMIGSKRDTQAYLDLLEQRFSTLEQFPVLQKRYSNLRPEIYQGAILKAAFFAQNHPELLSDCSWTSLNHRVGNNPLPKALPRYQDWLELLMPFGTTYNWNYRVWEIDEKTNMSVEEATQFQRWDPFNLSIVGYYLYTLFPEGNYTPEAVETACAATKAFDRGHYLDRMRSAYPDHSPEKLAVLRDLSNIDKVWLISVAKELAHLKREAEASEVFLQAYREVEDRVAISNSMNWEVMYLHRIGRVVEADKLAESCADVYSQIGIQSLALLREAEGRLPEAEAWFRKIAERYDDECALQAFHYRNRLKSLEYQHAWEQDCEKIFPLGLQKFTALQTPPTQGLVVQDDSAFLRHRGIAQGAIIVALDDFQVHDLQQYNVVRAFEWSDEMNLVVFQKGKYDIVHSDFQNRRLGVNLATYKPSRGAQ